MQMKVLDGLICVSRNIAMLQNSDGISDKFNVPKSLSSRYGLHVDVSWLQNFMFVAKTYLQGTEQGIPKQDGQRFCHVFK
jgi:hypothetical protein